MSMERMRAGGAAALWVALLGLLASPSAVAGEPGAMGALTERAVVERILAASPTVRAAQLTARAAAAGVRAEEARYTPSVYAELSGGHSERLGGSLEGTTVSGADSLAAEAGVQLDTPWGTEVTVGVSGGLERSEVTRDPTSANVLDLDTLYSAEARATVRQPLLRGAGRDVGEADLRAARHARRGAEHERDSGVSDQLRAALVAFWQLWSAEQAVHVERASLELAQRQREEAVERARQLGTGTEADVLRFDAEVASLAASLAQREALCETRALALGRMLGLAPGDSRSLSAAPAAGGTSAPLGAPSAEALEAALPETSELKALEADIARAREELATLRDDALPTLDLEASLTAGGLWDDRTIDSLGLPGDRPALTAMVGLRLELPVTGTRTDELIAQARFRIAASEAQLTARRQAVASEAASQQASLAAAERRVELARQSESVAARLATSEAERLALGLSTPLQVVEAQEQSRSAALQRIEATVDATVASLEIAHLTGGLRSHWEEQLAGASPARPADEE